MTRSAPRLAAALLGATLAAAPAAAFATEDDEPFFGSWRNPKNSVHVEIKPCGPQAACGTVIWASAKAKADARKGSGKDLVGLQLFRDLTRTKSGVWRGKVFVPDMNRTLTGTAQVLDGARFKASGCLIPNLLCKTQIWTKIS